MILPQYPLENENVFASATKGSAVINVHSETLPQRQRPTLHFTANCWINDPCAPGYDPHTGLYHLFYQANPHGTQWNRLSWGHLVSTDMLNWEQPSRQPALIPDQEYDALGVFTGCWMPPAHADDTTLRVIYSSINHLPFHWSTPPYPRDAAGLALAESLDGGKSWTKHSSNAFLQGEPANIAVTGFRDPFVAPWPSMDRALGKQKPGTYGIVAGGIQGHGPTAFLYDINPAEPTRWIYLWPLIDLPSRFQFSPKWSGNHGVNWECVNFLTIRSENEERDILIISAEGDVEREHISSHTPPIVVPPRAIRNQLWVMGNLAERDGAVKFNWKYSGFLDHGSYYAANSFLDPRSGRRIVYGWIPEEDITGIFAREKGWNGSLAMPREVFLQRISNVVGALKSELNDMCCFEKKTGADGTLTLLTLGVKPIEEIKRAHNASMHGVQEKINIHLPQNKDEHQSTLFTRASSSFEIETSVSFAPGCDSFGLVIYLDLRRTTYVTISFNLNNETITVDRSHSTTRDDVNTCPESGPFTLFTLSDKGIESLEKLRLRLFLDADVLEVFANERFALATMVYCNGFSEELKDVDVFVTGLGAGALVEEARIWDGLKLEGGKSRGIVQ